MLARAITEVAAGFPASTTTHFLRPTPPRPLTVTTQVVQRGRRLTIVDAELHADDRRVALQRMTLLSVQPAASLPQPTPRPVDPEHFIERRRAAPHGQPWMMDALDVREGDGAIWFRHRVPPFLEPSFIANTLIVADWAHGLGPPQGAEEPRPAAIPNTDLSVNLLRAPGGDWIGVEPASAWSDICVGVGWGSLRDENGLFGRVAMSIAITPLSVG